MFFAGDFNSRNVMWGLHTDTCGSRFWLCIRRHIPNKGNWGAVTFPRGLSQSALGLIICSHTLALKSWRTINCARSSHHFPILFVVGLFVPVQFIVYLLTKNRWVPFCSVGLIKFETTTTMRLLAWEVTGSIFSVYLFGSQHHILYLLHSHTFCELSIGD